MPNSHIRINQCCGSGMFIPDPGSQFFHPGSRAKKIPDPGSASKNLSIFNAKNCFYALGNMIRYFHPGSRILIFYPSRIRSALALIKRKTRVPPTHSKILRERERVGLFALQMLQLSHQISERKLPVGNPREHSLLQLRGHGGRQQLVLALYIELALRAPLPFLRLLSFCWRRGGRGHRLLFSFCLTEQWGRGGVHPDDTVEAGRCAVAVALWQECRVVVHSHQETATALHVVVVPEKHFPRLLHLSVNQKSIIWNRCVDNGFIYFFLIKLALCPQAWRKAR